MNPPTITIIAGPNGSGKTTFAQEHFKSRTKAELFLNADQIAKTLGSDDAQKFAMRAGRKVIEQREQLIKSQKSFIIETTLATRSLALALYNAKDRGFKIILHYLYITTPELCDFRVKDRVSKGGHNIPLEMIFRRYFLGMQYLKELYIELADEVHIYLADALPKLIFSKKRDWSRVKNKTEQKTTKNAFHINQSLEANQFIKWLCNQVKI